MPNNEDLRCLYQAAFEMHREIQDFRAKLLAILPLVSGAGLAALLEIYKSPTSKVLEEHLFGFGLFGFLIILGVYIYELRSIQNCHAIQNAARNLEDAISGEHQGVFRFEAEQSKPVAKIVRMTIASRIVYCTLMAAWSYVACFGLCKMLTDICSCFLRSDVTASLVAGVLVLVIGFAVSCMIQRCQENSGPR